MEIINFQCGHCGNLMGVSTDCLGQQVRCPTCAQVVVAPAARSQPAPPAPPAPAPAPLPAVGHDHEDIFTPPESDDLFSPATQPRLEIPGPTVNPAPPAPQPAGHLPAAHLPAAHLPAVPMPAAAAAPVPEPVNAGAMFQDDPSAGAPTPSFEGDPADANPEQAARRAQRQADRRRSTGLLLVLLPLISYSVLVTATLVWVWLQMLRFNQLWEAEKSKALPEQPKLLDQLPDLEGDNPGTKRTNLTWKVGDTYAWPMPDDLKVPLGKKLQLGDLEVEPLQVVRTRVSVFVEGSRNKETMPNDSLVLHLRLRNLAKGYAFVPLDAYFDRGWSHKGASPERPAADAGPDALARYRVESNAYWERGKDWPASPRHPEDAAPLTVLEVGERRFFGSSSDWYDRKKVAAQNLHRAWVEGRQDQMPYLKPGEAMETFVSTDGRDPRLDEALRAAPGPLLYRVHLRRGLVRRTKGDNYPATAVIGVPFTSGEIVDGAA